MTHFQIAYASIMLSSVLAVSYFAYINRNKRLSNILMALGLTCQAIAVLADFRPAMIIAALLSLVLIAVSLFISIPSLLARPRISR